MSQDIHFSEKLACSSLWDSQVHETNTGWNLENKNKITRLYHRLPYTYALSEILCTQATEHFNHFKLRFK